MSRAGTQLTFNGVADGVGLTLILLLLVLLPIMAIVGSVSAANYRDDVWQAVGRRRVRWIWQAAGLFVLPVVLIYSGLYFIRVRPQLQAAEAAAVLAQSRSDWQEVGSTSLGSAITFGDADRTEVRFRLARSRFWLLALSLPSQAPISLSVYFRRTSDWTLYFVVGLDLFLISFFLIVLSVGGSALSPSGVRFNTLRRRRIPWPEVGAVTQHLAGGSRRVALWTTAGKRVWMAAPATGLTRRRQEQFDQDFATIGDYWLSHRGDGPLRPPGGTIR